MMLRHSLRAAQLVARRPCATPRRPLRSFHATASAAFRFKLHDIGEGITEVEIIKWAVKPGDRVDEFDSLCEVQSDKSVVDITSPHAGVVTSLAAEPGGVVRVGQALCEIDAGDASEAGEPRRDVGAATGTGGAASHADPVGPVSPSAAIDRAPVSPAAPHASAREDAPTSTLASPVPEAEETAVRLHGEASVLLAPPAALRLADNVPPVPPRTTGSGPAHVRVRASPAVRAFAAQLGVPLENLHGTGPDGRIEKDNVLAAVDSSKSASRSSSSMETGAGESVTVKMSRTRRAMYRAMAKQAAVPHFGYSHTLDLTSILPFMRPPGPTKASYVAADVRALAPAPRGSSDVDGGKTSFLAWVVKTLLLATRQHPIMRSHGDGEMLDVAATSTLAIAVSDAERGLLTPSLPVIPPTSSIVDIDAALRALRARPAAPAAPASRPAHIAISSVGSLGEASSAAPVLPPGATAICVVGRARWTLEPALRDGRGSGGDSSGGSVWDMTPDEVVAGGVRARLTCPVSWSGDHRILEGAELIAFTETWKQLVEEPAVWMRP